MTMQASTQRSWKKTFGIDLDIPIAEKDRKETDEKFSVGEGGQHSPPMSVQVLPFLPMAIVGNVGLATTYFLGLPLWTLAIVAVATLVAFWAGSNWVARWYMGPLYRRELRSRGYNICLHCGHWLRDLADDASNCPECGKAVKAIANGQ